MRVLPSAAVTIAVHPENRRVSGSCLTVVIVILSVGGVTPLPRPDQYAPAERTR